jgi:hypothetical protein
MDNTTNKAAVLVQQHVMQVVQEAVNMGSLEADKAAYLAAMAALGGIIPMALYTGKRPKIDDVDALTGYQKNEIMASMVKEETILFCALLVANSIQSFDKKTCELQTTLGPGILWETLQQWQTLNKDKKPEDYLEPNLIAAAVDHGKSASAPFDEFLKKRADDQGHQAPKTIQ